MSDTPSPTSSCLQCGALLDSDAPAGLCSLCVSSQATRPLPPKAVDLTGLDVTVPVAAPVASGSARQQHFDLPLPEELTDLLPHGAYKIESFLGQGGMGAVYKGVQVRLKRPIAVKIMRRDIGKDHDFEARFEREAQAMAKLNHPNIVSVIDYGEAGPDYLYIVMELVDGADLMDVIRGGQMTQEMALTLLPQICDALQFAHDHGIVHRDIKPSNIMLTREGRIKMADFGLAKRFDAESSFRTQTGTGMGTPDYAAPEQFDPYAQIDHRADIYALGVMIYQMITGQLPRGVWKPPSQRADVSSQWDEIVGRAMQSDPSDRYQQASEVKTDVSSIPLAGKTDAATPARTVLNGGVAEKNQEVGKGTLTPLLVGTAVAMLGIATIFLFGKKQPQNGAEMHPLASTSSSVAPQISANSAEPWQECLHDPAKINLTPGLEVTNEGLRFAEAGAVKILGRITQRNGAVRMRATYGGLRPQLLARESTDGVYMLLVKEPGIVELDRWDTASSRTIVLNKFPLRVPLKEGQDYELELRFIGEVLTAKLNSEELGQVKDASNTQGTMGLRVTDQSGAPCLVKEIDKLDLDPRNGARPSPSPAPQVSKSSDPKFPPGQWVKVFTKAEDLPAELRKPELGIKFEDGWWSASNTKKSLYAGGNSQNWNNAGIRFRTRYVDKGVASIAIRDMANRSYQINLDVPSGSWRLKHFDPTTEPKTTFLGESPSGSNQLVDNGEYVLELAAVGDRVIARVDSRLVASVRDQRLPSGRMSAFLVTPVNNIEVINLDGLPEAEALKILGVDEKGNDVRGKAGATTGAEKWEDVLSTKLSLTGGAELKPQGLRFPSGSFANFDRAHGPKRDGAVRMLATFDGSPVELHVRTTTGVGYYSLSARDDKVIWLRRWNEAANAMTELGKYPLRVPLKLGQDYRLELRFVGQTLTATFNGEALGSVTDGTYQEGHLGAGVTSKTATPSLVKTLEVLNLDAPSKGSPAPSLPVSSSPSSATQTAPFINTLGMKFVPVPITGGPTKGQRVLFGMWDTRVQDYAAFAAANPKADGSWQTQEKDGVPAGRERDHPVVGVNWQDAQAFCQWLTAKETAEGKLPQGMKYRLPSDEEWSWAVGLPLEQGATPAEKNRKNNVDFPWGKNWPPKGKVGNFADEAFHTKFPLNDAIKEEWFKNRWIEGYTDGYATTSPVGIFPANAHGLYDMEGNVWQWCEEWFDASQKSRVLRGGTWSLSDRASLLSSNRGAISPDFRNGNYSFRCVLAPSITSFPSLPAAKSSDQKLPPGQWVKMFTKAEDLPAELRKPNSGFVWEDGWIRRTNADSAVVIPLPTILKRNYGVRVLALRGRGQTEGIVLHSRAPGQDKLGGHFQFKLEGNKMGIQQRDGTKYLSIYAGSLSEAQVKGQSYSEEFAAVGNRLIARSGSNVKMITGTEWKEGTGYINVGEDVRDIEVINLDGLPEAEALKILGVDEKGSDLRGK